MLAWWRQLQSMPAYGNVVVKCIRETGYDRMTLDALSIEAKWKMAELNWVVVKPLVTRRHRAHIVSRQHT